MHLPLLADLQRRRVFRALLGYAIVARAREAVARLRGRRRLPGFSRWYVSAPGTGRSRGEDQPQGEPRMKLRTSAKVLAITVLAFAACHSPMLVADAPLMVLKEPYPAGYPTTKPIPNSIVAALSLGQRVKVTGDGYGKDFMYYRVALPDAGSGYVIYGEGAFHIEK